jgi:hypothetical protein
MEVFLKKLILSGQHKHLQVTAICEVQVKHCECHLLKLTKKGRQWTEVG